MFYPLLFPITVVGSLSQPVANAWRLFLEKAAAL
jgi:F0F1-type ATP synthase membrane subunit a